MLNRNLIVLSLVSLLNDFSTDMAFPLLPYFVLLLGGGAVAVGLMEGFADSVAAFLRYMSGRLSDRLGRRKALTFVGYSLSAFAKAFYFVAAHLAQVVVIRASDRVGKGFREAPRDAILAESVPRAHWGFGYGFHRMMDTTGALLGPLAALVLIHYLGTGEPALRTLFLVAAIPGVLGLLLFFAVRETGAGPSARLPPGRFIPRRAFSGPLGRYLGVTGLFTLGHLSVAFLVLRATELGLPLVSIIYLYIWFNAAETVGSLPVGALTDRIGRRPVLAFAYASFAATFLLAAVVGPSNWWSLLPFFVLLGFARALREGQGRAFVADLSPGDLRATGFGSYHATIGFLSLPAGLLAGWLWGIDFRLTFLIAAIACLTALWLFVAGWLAGGFDRGPDDARQDEHAAPVHEPG